MKWNYEIDGNLSIGSDCRRLDKLEYTALSEIKLNRKQFTANWQRVRKLNE